METKYLFISDHFRASGISQEKLMQILNEKKYLEKEVKELKFQKYILAKKCKELTKIKKKSMNKKKIEAKEDQLKLDLKHLSMNYL